MTRSAMNKRRKLLTPGWRALLFFVSALALGCQSQTGSRNTVPNRDIKTVMEAHVEELMAIPGVVGVAIGELDDHTPCIQVLVIEQTEELTRRIPKSLEGHPVVILVSGEIKPMRDDSP